MKKILLLFLLTVAFVANSQVTVTVLPKYGCPNTSGNTIMVNVMNTSGFSVPNGITMSYSINLIENSITIGTTSGTDNTGWTNNTSKVFTMSAVSFGNASTCTVSGSASIPALSLNFPVNESYIVQFPPDLTATEAPAGTIAVSGSTDYSVRFYLNGDYGTVAHETTGTTYSPSVDGDYTVKAYDPTTGCISQNPSAQVSITTSIQEALSFKVSVFPNPSVSELNISAENSVALSYELSDLNGKVFSTGNFAASTKINTESLQSGVYLLKVKDGSGQFNSYKITK